MINSIKKPQHTKKKVIIAISVIVVVSAIAVAYFTHRNSSTKPATTPTAQKPINYTPPTDSEKAAGNQIKEQALDSQKQTGGSSDTSSTIPLVITSTNQSSGMVYIRVIIQQVTSAGDCTLSMSNGSGGTYTATSHVQSMASSSTCAGFNVPVSKLTPGSWDIDIKYANGASSGTVTGSITVQ